MDPSTQQHLIQEMDRRVQAAVGTDAKLDLLSRCVARLKRMKADREAAAQASRASVHSLDHA